jgi:hypothetical protein
MSGKRKLRRLSRPASRSEKPPDRHPLALPAMSVHEARTYLRERREHGAECPVCGRIAKLYRRQLHRSIVATMAAMYARRGLRPVYLPSIEQRSRDVSFAAHWGLIRRVCDAEGRAIEGKWRITPRGRAWLRGELTVPRYAVVYLGECLRLEGEPWSVHDAAGERFRIEDL